MWQDTQEIFRAIPLEAVHLLLVLFLSFLVGLEREGRKLAGPGAFGGVRTFPMIGLLGYGLTLLSPESLWPAAVGLAVVGGLLAVAYAHKVQLAEANHVSAGLSSEMSALLIYVVGGLVQRGQYWISCTLVVAALLLLELKGALEKLSRRIPRDELLTLAQFLVLAVVILPIVPNRNFTSFQLNPFKTWLVVVAVATISYGSYVLQKLLKEQGGVLLAAVVGGLYSSTVTTVALAKKSKVGGRPHLFAGGILMASGTMYLRLALLVGLFGPDLRSELVPIFCALATVGLGGGFLWSRLHDTEGPRVERGEPRNPLELSAAFLFAVIFLGMMVVTQLVLRYLGSAGVFGLAAIMGVSDVDPFILSITQSAGTATPVALAGGAIALAAASNNLVKGIYAKSFGDRSAGNQAFLLLAVLAGLGLVPLLWIH